MGKLRLPNGALTSLLVAGWLAVPAGGALALSPDADAGRRLDDVERALDAGRKQAQDLEIMTAGLESEVRRLQRDRVAAARAIQDSEAEILRLEARLARLARSEAGKSARLAARRDQSVGVLMALQRLALHPPEAMIAQPMSLSQTVRSAILLRAAVPEIERRADRLRADLAGLARARREAGERRLQLASAVAGLAERRTHLNTLLARKTELKRRTATQAREAARRVQALAREAQDLRDLLARLEKERRQREAKAKAAAEDAARPGTLPASLGGEAPSISKARGMLPFPAVGRLTGRYGQATRTGLTRKGITIETRAGAQVVSPHEGRVVFAGPFRKYGQLLIIEHGEGYYSLLAGLARIDGVIGQWILGGEPVGIMGRPENGNPALYMELRRNGQPINPLPWLAARKGKVSG
ncbi:MAG: peptidoglycan DD-metalloendopeptidase family protein [Proteobacteria bacterium]|nr:peptidoglycan DD-metalloendopeptidase family protein [Pseudomonadota bacterium]